MKSPCFSLYLLLFTPFTATWSKSIPDHLRWWDFAPYVSGFCHIHGKTPRGILPVNSSLYFSIYMSELLYLFQTDKGFIDVSLKLLYRTIYRKAGNISLCKIFPAFLRLLQTITIDRLIASCCLTDFTGIWISPLLLLFLLSPAVQEPQP